MARIGIDCRFASAFGGLGRYTRELVTAMIDSEESLHTYILFVKSEHEEWLNALPKHPECIITPFEHYSFAEQIRFPTVLRRANIDLFFSPHFNVPFRCPIPFVTTIHDLILHTYPNTASFPKRAAYKVLMRYALKHAREIIAVSAFTAKEIFVHYPTVSPEHVHVVTEGVHERFRRASESAIQDVRATYHLEKPFFLYVGNNKQHKNVSTLCEAYRQLAAPSTELVLVTGGKEAAHLREGDGICILQNVQEDDLPALYSAARAVVTASYYEGYCLPVAEAQACHAPVIASATSAIPEIATSETRLIQPTVEAWVQALRNPPTEVDLTWTPPRWQDAALHTHAILDRALHA